MMYNRIQCVILSVFMLNLMTAVHAHGQEAVKSDVLNHMKAKWSKFFDISDLNKDGTIDKAERDKHTQLVKDALNSEVQKTVALNSEVQKTVAQAIKNVNDAYQCVYFRYGNNKQGNVKKQDFLNGLEKEYEKSPQEVEKHFMACDKKYVTSIDINNDGRISWTEYKIHRSHIYVIKEEMLKNDFLQWNPSIQDKEFLEALVQYQSKDTSKTNQIDKEMKEGMFDKEKEK